MEPAVYPAFAVPLYPTGGSSSSDLQRTALSIPQIPTSAGLALSQALSVGALKGDLNLFVLAPVQVGTPYRNMA